MLKEGKTIYNLASLNPAIIFNIFTRIVQSAGGIITLLLITRFLNKDEQGYFYTFSSFLSIQIFFELGLTSIITQYVAHEAAHLSITAEQALSGESFFQSRLAALVQLSIKWFAVLSVVLFGVLFISGKYFFSSFNAELNIAWQFPWLILSASTSVLLIVNLFLAILEGLGKIDEVNKVRLVQYSMNLFFVTIFFFINFKLLSTGLAFLLTNLIIGGVLYINFKPLIANIWNIQIKEVINYRREIVPYVTRIALGNISGYLIYQLINPVLFATQSPLLAGQMGATQTFLNGISVVSSSWLSTKVAVFSNYVSKRNFRRLNLVYKKNLFISIIVCCTGLLIFTIVISLLKTYLPTLGNRFLNTIPIIFLALTQLAAVIGNSQAYYLRSFKQEPFFIPSIVVGVLSGASTVLCSKYFGITEITFAYFIINGVFGFIWGCIIFRNKSYEWTRANLMF